MPDILCPQQHLQIAACKRTDTQLCNHTVSRQWGNIWRNLHRQCSTLKRNDVLLDAPEHFVARADFWIALTKFHPDEDNRNRRRAGGSNGCRQTREQVAVLRIALNGARLNIHDEQRGLV